MKVTYAGPTCRRARATTRASFRMALRVRGLVAIQKSASGERVHEPGLRLPVGAERHQRAIAGLAHDLACGHDGVVHARGTAAAGGAAASATGPGGRRVAAGSRTGRGSRCGETAEERASAADPVSPHLDVRLGRLSEWSTRPRARRRPDASRCRDTPSRLPTSRSRTRSRIGYDVAGAPAARLAADHAPSPCTRDPACETQGAERGPCLLGRFAPLRLYCTLERPSAAAYAEHQPQPGGPPGRAASSVHRPPTPRSPPRYPRRGTPPSRSWDESSQPPTSPACCVLPQFTRLARRHLDSAMAERERPQAATVFTPTTSPASASYGPA